MGEQGQQKVVPRKSRSTKAAEVDWNKVGPRLRKALEVCVNSSEGAERFWADEQAIELLNKTFGKRRA